MRTLNKKSTYNRYGDERAVQAHLAALKVTEYMEAVMYRSHEDTIDARLQNACRAMVPFIDDHHHIGRIVAESLSLRGDRAYTPYGFEDINKQMTEAWSKLITLLPFYDTEEIDQ